MSGLTKFIGIIPDGVMVAIGSICIAVGVRDDINWGVMVAVSVAVSVLVGSNVGVGDGDVVIVSVGISVLVGIGVSVGVSVGTGGSGVVSCDNTGTMLKIRKHKINATM